jgi:hypothetical protein
VSRVFTTSRFHPSILFAKFVTTPKVYGLKRQTYCRDPAKCKG